MRPWSERKRYSFFSVCAPVPVSQSGEIHDTTTTMMKKKISKAVDFIFKPSTDWNVDLRVANFMYMSLYRTKVDTMPIDEYTYSQIIITTTTTRQCPSFDRHTRNRVYFLPLCLIPTISCPALSLFFFIRVAFVVVREWSVHNVRYVASQLF